MDADSKLPVVAWMWMVGDDVWDISSVRGRYRPDERFVEHSLVRQSDAESALAELRAEVERLRQENRQLAFLKFSAEMERATVFAHFDVLEQRAEAAEARLERAREFLLGAYRELDAETDSGEELKARIAAFLGENK